jgi:hypothetical protein
MSVHPHDDNQQNETEERGAGKQGHGNADAGSFFAECERDQGYEPKA